MLLPLLSQFIYSRLVQCRQQHYIEYAEMCLYSTCSQLAHRNFIGLYKWQLVACSQSYKNSSSRIISHIVVWYVHIVNFIVTYFHFVTFQNKKYQCRCATLMIQITECEGFLARVITRPLFAISVRRGIARLLFINKQYLQYPDK